MSLLTARRWAASRASTIRKATKSPSGTITGLSRRRCRCAGAPQQVLEVIGTAIRADRRADNFEDLLGSSSAATSAPRQPGYRPRRRLRCLPDRGSSRSGPSTSRQKRHRNNWSNYWTVQEAASGVRRKERLERGGVDRLEPADRLLAVELGAPLEIGEGGGDREDG